MQSVLDRIFLLQQRSGLKPTPLTKQLGISASSFTDWSKGKGSPSLEILMKFSEYFDVSLDWLVYGKERASKNLPEFKNVDEARLVTKYRQLTPEQKFRLDAYVDGMLDSIKAEEDSSQDVKLSV